MSFYNQPQRRWLFRIKANAQRYGPFFAYRDRDEICRALADMIRKQRTETSVRSWRPKRAFYVIEDMNRILEAGRYPTISARAFNSFFDMKRMYVAKKQPDPGAGENEPNALEIARKYHSPRLYIERRYWGQPATQAFCVAAGLSAEEAARILGPIMGQPWLYLRDPYSLVTDYALSKGLSTAQTVELLLDTDAVIAQQAKDGGQALQEEELEALTVQLGSSYIERLKNRDMESREQAVEQFKRFVRQEADILSGSYDRSLGVIRRLIWFEGWPAMGIVPDQRFARYFHGTGKPGGEKAGGEKTNLKFLAAEMAKTFVPWEAKERRSGVKRNRPRSAEPGPRSGEPEAAGAAAPDKKERWKLLETGADRQWVIYERLRSYMKPQETRKIRYAEMRLDLLRLLLIYRVTDIGRINDCLRDLSFSELNPNLPFDFFVLAAVIYGTGPEVNDRNGDPYGVLTDLMAYYAAAEDEERI